MGGWTDLEALARAALRPRAARVALSVAGHVLVLGGLLAANPWHLRPVATDLPLGVELVTLAPEPEPEPPANAAPPPAPAPAPVLRPMPAAKPAPDPAPAPEPEGVTIELPDLPESEGETGSIVDGTGAPSVDPALEQAIAALICHRMKDHERAAAGCADQPPDDPFERAPAIALLNPEERRIQAIRTGQIARTAGYDNFLEWYLEHDAPIPGTFLDGIDNTIFLDRKDAASAEHDRLMRGDTPDWADDIAEAHGRE